MLNSRLEIFYKKIICEDFIVLYNMKNITLLPFFEKGILSSTSKDFGSSENSVLQSFYGWHLCTSQKSIITRAHKSIAFFNIREKALLGLKVTLRKKALFSFLDKVLIFFLPLSMTFNNNIKGVQNNKHQSASMVHCHNKNQNNLLQGSQTKLVEKSVLALYDLQRKFLADTGNNKVVLKSNTKKNNYLIIQKKSKFNQPSLITKEKAFSCFTLSNRSALSFPEITSLSLFFNLVSGFSMTVSLKRSSIRDQLLHNFSITQKDLIKKQLLSAFGYPRVL